LRSQFALLVIGNIIFAQQPVCIADIGFVQHIGLGNVLDYTGRQSFLCSWVKTQCQIFCLMELSNLIFSPSILLENTDGTKV